MDEVQKKMEKKFSMFSKNSKLLTKVVRVLNVGFLLCGFLCACSVALPQKPHTLAPELKNKLRLFLGITLDCHSKFAFFS
jgi:hypothetical protein